MKRSSRIITFLVVTALTYGSLFALVGPEKVRDWHKSHRFHRYHHGHHEHHDLEHHERKQDQSESKVEEL